MLRQVPQKLRKTLAALTLLSAELLVILLLFVVALLGFAYLIRKVIVLQQTGFDKAVFSFLQAFVNDGTTRVMQAITFLGTHRFLIPANLSLIVYFLFIRRHKWYSIKVPAIALSSLGLMFALKNFFGRPRPDVPLVFRADGLSFPSGHALFSVTFYGLLAYIIYHTVKPAGVKWLLITLLLLLMVVIGFTRVYLRVHYATDVLAGFCVGFIWLAFALWALNRLEQFSRKKASAVTAGSATGV